MIGSIRGMLSANFGSGIDYKLCFLVPGTKAPVMLSDLHNINTFRIYLAVPAKVRAPSMERRQPQGGTKSKMGIRL